jgi:transcriptional regulator with XRE-family HTH domain
VGRPSKQTTILRAARRAKRIPLQEVANVIGVSRARYSEAELHREKPLPIDKLLTVIAFFGVDPGPVVIEEGRLPDFVLRCCHMHLAQSAADMFRLANAIKSMSSQQLSELVSDLESKHGIKA